MIAAATQRPPFVSGEPLLVFCQGEVCKATYLRGSTIRSGEVIAWVCAVDDQVLLMSGAVYGESCALASDCFRESSAEDMEQLAKRFDDYAEYCLSRAENFRMIAKRKTPAAERP